MKILSPFLPRIVKTSDVPFERYNNKVRSALQSGLWTTEKINSAGRRSFSQILKNGRRKDLASQATLQCQQHHETLYFIVMSTYDRSMLLYMRTNMLIGRICFGARCISFCEASRPGLLISQELKESYLVSLALSHTFHL